MRNHKPEQTPTITYEPEPVVYRAEKWRCLGNHRIKTRRESVSDQGLERFEFVGDSCGPKTDHPWILRNCSRSALLLVIHDHGGHLVVV